MDHTSILTAQASQIAAESASLWRRIARGLPTGGVAAAPSSALGVDQAEAFLDPVEPLIRAVEADRMLSQRDLDVRQRAGRADLEASDAHLELAQLGLRLLYYGANGA